MEQSSKAGSGKEMKQNSFVRQWQAGTRANSFYLFTATDLEYSCKRESSWLRRTTIAFGIKHLQEKCLQD